jgi:FixJ family two-component response regulator
VLFLWPLLAWAGTAVAADSDRPRQVLLLYAESRLLPGLIEAGAAIFMTGHGDVSTGVRAMKGGAVDFLEKPVSAQDLLACVQRGLARSWLNREERAARAAVERRFATLTARERDVLRLVVTGMLNKQIAGELGIAEKTVKIHRSHMMHKMEAGSVAELVAMTQKLEPPGSRP